MKNYFKKFSVMFVMALAIIGIGAIQNGSVANAAESDYTLNKDYSTNLIADYKFDETSGTTCIDSTGHYNGTYNGTTSVAGINGNARNFNGTSDYISFNNPIIPVGKKSIRFEVKTSNLNTKDYTIIGNSEWGATDKTYGTNIVIFGNSRGVNTGKIYVRNVESANSNSVFNIVSNLKINDNKWHDVLFTWDGTTNNAQVKLYIDGVLDSTSTALKNEVTIGAKNLTIGVLNNYTLDNYLQGDISNVEIYNDVIEYKKSLSLDKSTLDLTVGDSKQLTSTTTPASAEVVWTSSDSTIATVDSTGKVTGVKEGQAIITAQIKDSDTKATCVVNVTAPTTPNEPTTGTGLFIELVDGNIKQYDLTSDQINSFINWYKNRDLDDSQPPFYKFTKGTYTDYVVHDKIDWFEIR
jgi:Bacterial surface proteins containing Ig-like domains